MPFARRRSTIRSRTRSEVSACALVNATFGAPLRSAALALGRGAACWGAGRLASEFASVALSLVTAGAAGLTTALMAALAMGLATGVAEGLTAGLATGVAEDLAAGLVTGVAEDLAAGLVTGVAEDLAAGLATGVAEAGAGALAECCAVRLPMVSPRAGVFARAPAARASVAAARFAARTSPGRPSGRRGSRFRSSRPSGKRFARSLVMKRRSRRAASRAPRATCRCGSDRAAAV
jgi:hypothetical protein